MMKSKWKAKTVGGLGVAAIVVWLLHASLASSNSSPEAVGKGEGAAVPVICETARQMRFERTLVLSGNVEAQVCALVSPRVPGTLTDIFVDEGDMVKAGETRLFQTDPVKLTKAVDIARQQHAVARCTVLEKEASLERTEADMHKARLDYDRAKKLVHDKVITTSAYESEESRFLQAKASLKHAKVLVELSEEQRKQAHLNLDIAEKDLRDSLSLSPIDGVVSQRFSEPGEMGLLGKAVLKLENPRVLEVSAFLPEEYYGEVTVGKTLLRVWIGSYTVGEKAVAYKSPSVDETMRTFEVKCVLNDSPAGVTPGRIARVEVILEARQGLGVPRDSIEMRGGKAVVFSLENAMAQQVAVQPGLETNGWIELCSPEKEKAARTIRTGAPIITQGQTFVEDGMRVNVIEESK